MQLRPNGRLRGRWPHAAIAVALAALPAIAAQPATDGPASRPAANATVYLALTDGRHVSGVPLSADDEKVVLKVGEQTRTIPLDEIEPVGIYMVRKHFADLTKPSVRMELGGFLLEHGQLSLAQREFSEAVRLDPDLADQVTELLRAAAESAEAERAPTDEEESQPKKRPRPTKYGKPTKEEIEANHKRARELAEKAKAVAPALHLVETEHFLIFSSWPRARDKALGTLCEKMYRTYCVHFNVRPDENVFVGKCPVFIFWEKEQFRQFARDIDKTGLGAAAGYVSYKDGRYCHIAMNALRVYDKFCELLVHEGTHAFMSRYISSRRLPRWVNEGLAEYMAATVVPRTWAAARHRKAVGEAVRTKKDVSYIFERVETNEFDYGIAQSIVRFMIETNRRSFARFVTLIKEGTGEKEALKESFDCTHQELLARWWRAVAKKHGG